MRALHHLGVHRLAPFLSDTHQCVRARARVRACVRACLRDLWASHFHQFAQGPLHGLGGSDIFRLHVHVHLIFLRGQKRAIGSRGGKSAPLPFTCATCNHTADGLSRVLTSGCGTL